MSELVQFLVAGLKNGSIYALVALGFTLVYGATGAINFAQGEFFMLGGVLCVVFSSLGLPVPLAVILAIIATALIGAAFELIAIRPLGSNDPLRIVMVTIGGSLLMRQLVLHAVGPDELTMEPFTSGPSIALLGAAIDRQTLWIWGATIVAVVLLAWLYRRTAFGRAMRATAMNRDAARLVGIDAQAMVTASFALAAGLGALAGLVVAPLTQTAFNAGASMGVKGFSAAILGGLGSPVAALMGGLVLGVLESLTAGYLDPVYKDAVALVVLLLVLFVRPSGLFGREGREKV